LLPVAVYARYSTDRQDSRSIDDQMRRCGAHATANSYQVVAEFKDAAISGSHVLRADMQRLLAAARAKSGPPFRAVLVDDLSRLSRDLGDTWQIVFRDLASVDVRVIDVTTGLASDGAGARLTFGALALVNDTFLQLVRTETHRGLEGRALGGFSTGGRCYGYRTVVEPSPPDPEHPRKRFIIDDMEAHVVRRVFELYASGGSFKRIACTLNEEGYPAPNDGGRGNKNGHGWGHTTIREMLLNERYVGRVVWNQSKWVRIPGRKSRKRVMRPESDWVVQQYPELVIVPRPLWDATRARFQKRPRGPGRPPGSGKHVYLVSGLLRCGICGGSMSIISRKKKADVSYTRFGCTTHASRGNSVCRNSLSISEKKVTRTVVNALKQKLDRPELIERFVRVFKEKTAAHHAERSKVTDEAERRIRDVDRRIANLTDSLARAGWSDALAAKLRDEETQLAKLKADRASTPVAPVPRIVPHPATIAAYLKNLWTLLDTDPARGRDVLSRFVAPVVLTPLNAEGPGRSYRATGAFNFSFFLSGAFSGSGISSCAGLQRPLPHPKSSEESAIWAPFTGVLVIGWR
jgi:DNA invertase Pin-like site-specific DNA recombinase